ncbi:MAG: cation:proton antiporter [Thermoleophilia bacterium]|nr:cation:proton antiporter [Thermoleophilia bacterium]
MITLPLAAGGPVAEALVDLFIVLLAAKIGDEIFKRIRQPTIIGEILAGVIVGPAVFGLVGVTEVLEVFAELGVVFLLFWVGLETRITDLREVGSSAVRTGVLGVVLPFAGGFGLGVALGESTSTSAFLGAALVATSVGITSAVLIELGALTSRAGRTIIGAAIVDDILAMLILAVAVGLAAGGTNVVGLLVVVVLALSFVAFFALGGTAVMRRWPGTLAAPKFSESPLLPAVILCLGLAALAAEIGLAAIIGAFLAGMMVAETKEQHPVEEEVAPLYAFFPPFFFVVIGMQLDLEALAQPGTILLLVGVTALAAATKFVGAWLGARSLGKAEAAFVGVGMVPRGEVGIIVAGIGEASGVIGPRVFAIVVGMSILTTLLVPPVLRVLAKRLPPDRVARGLQPS